MGLITLFLSLIDILGSLIIFFQYFPISLVVLYFGYILLVKGVWSILSSFSSGYYFDWMGFIDTISGISLILIYYNLKILPFTLIAILALFKGLYSLFLSL